MFNKLSIFNVTGANEDMRMTCPSAICNLENKEQNHEQNSSYNHGPVLRLNHWFNAASAGFSGSSLGDLQESAGDQKQMF